MSRKLIILIMAIFMVMGMAGSGFANPIDESRISDTASLPDDALSSPDKFTSYLISLGDTYDATVTQFSALSAEQQQAFLAGLRDFDNITLSISIERPNIPPTRGMQSISMDAIFSFMDINLLSIRMEGRYTTSGSQAVTAEYGDAYVTQLLLPGLSVSRTSLDYYVSNGIFYESSSLQALVGIGGVGVIPRNFYLEMQGNGYGRTYANTW